MKKYKGYYIGTIEGFTDDIDIKTKGEMKKEYGSLKEMFKEHGKRYVHEIEVKIKPVKVKSYKRRK